MFRRRREPAEPAEPEEPAEPAEHSTPEPRDQDRDQYRDQDRDQDRDQEEPVEDGGWTPPPEFSADTEPETEQVVAVGLTGPFDAANVPEDGLPRLDLGGMRVPVFEGGELRVEVDEESGGVVGATVVSGESALQLHPFAAPRTAGIWDEVRREIAGSIEESGGSAEEAPGEFGTELRATVPAQLPDGSVVAAPARFVGVDGPRWFLRGVFTGPASVDADAAALLETAFRRVVVVRGGDPMAPRDPIPMRLPPELAELQGGPLEEEPDDGEPGFDPFQRGPEITEVR